jgi:DinB superfamily
MDSYAQRALHIMDTASQGMSVEQLTRHRPGKWSASDILEHLACAFSSTSKLLERHLSAGHPSTAKPTGFESKRRLLVITLGYMPTGVMAPPFTLPRGIPADQAVARFRETLEEMDRTVRRCEERFGSRATIASHAIFGPLTARQWRRFHWVHTRHHAKQIKALRAARDLKEDSSQVRVPRSA